MRNAFQPILNREDLNQNRLLSRQLVDSMESISRKYQRLQRAFKEQFSSIKCAGSTPNLSDTPAKSMLAPHQGPAEELYEATFFDITTDDLAEIRSDCEDTYNLRDAPNPHNPSILGHLYSGVGDENGIHSGAKLKADIFCEYDSTNHGEKTHISTKLEEPPAENQDFSVKLALPLSTADKRDARCRPLFKYNESTRMPSKRRLLHGKACSCCSKYYECQDDKGSVDRISRHKFQHLPPSTPPGFWDIGFTQKEE
ncbi:hypothetical protein DI09_51p10 [Mitosporidium daphniae]|uniref:DNA endonuclease activator Ctp1 C-terminal domain-containing protein n=1 Tax=Mitosporidium daphniae TaxID=1485682 RepID=A0A098VPL9_9MICR|nr:uncharacterized protein DI09_51p10 [Mitosporidium daphniae]KGG50875.1 hypothetical protein DI09_51p10 [Mitosporidium daphniae]|eukprot:XP_013237317.1 uncharacterized protein DI09_51p10 [Mitosporidium daphniae]